MQLLYFFIYASYLIVPHLYSMYNNSNNNIKRAVNEIFNSLEDFSLVASRGWKKLASGPIVSGAAPSEDNENNRHLFVSSVVVVSILHVVYRSTYESWPLSFCRLKAYTSPSVGSKHSTRAMMHPIYIYHACIKRIEIKYEIVPLSTYKSFDQRDINYFLPILLFSS